VAKFPVLNGKQVVHALEKAGFEVVRTKGSHHFLKRGSPKRSVTVPVHGNRELPPGTLRAIIDQSGMSAEEFISLL